jgi:hypothetical protein
MRVRALFKLIGCAGCKAGNGAGKTEGTTTTEDVDVAGGSVAVTGGALGETDGVGVVLVGVCVALCFAVVGVASGVCCCGAGVDTVRGRVPVGEEEDVCCARATAEKARTRRSRGNRKRFFISTFGLSFHAPSDGEHSRGSLFKIRVCGGGLSILL